MPQSKKPKKVVTIENDGYLNFTKLTKKIISVKKLYIKVVNCLKNRNYN